MNHRDSFLRLAQPTLALFAGLVLWTASPVMAGAQTCSDDQTERATNYSLYYEDFKNGNYEASLPYLRWILKCAPGFPSGNDRNFRRAVEAYEKIGMASEDAGRKRTYLDSALYVFDTTVERLKAASLPVDEFHWTFQKGFFVQQHAAELPDLQGGVGALYRAAFEMDAARMQPYYVNYIIADFVQQGDKAAAVSFMDEVEDKIQGVQEITDLLATWRGQLFTSPEERIAFLESQLEKNPDDKELMAELFQLFIDEEGYRDRVYEMAPRMMELDPSARTFRMIARMRLEDGETDEAIRLYQQSLDMPGGMDGAREVHYNIGIAHQQEGRLSRARTSFREALAVDPNYGAAIIGIGDLYVSAVQGCGSFEREDKAVYWLAADYYERAAARDNAAASAAQNRLSNIRRYFPSAEDKFFKGWNAGDSFTIDYGCYGWIGESTRVR